MSHRARASRVRQHVHCDSCYSRRCRARVEVSVCCAFIPCRLLCGALFHLCKEEDHLLLCPNVRVPCLNAEYGCPIQLPRSSRAAHLLVCPASVVCCSMEWNRWPANDAHSFPNTELHENLLREKEQRGCLDLAMALKDQDRLFHSIKMKKLFPELIQTVEEEEKEEERREEERRKEEKRKAAEKAALKGAKDHTWKSFNMFDQTPDGKEDEDEDEDEYEDIDEDEEEVEINYEHVRELTQEEREAIARASGVHADLLENYNAWERMFSMEMSGCRETEGAAGTGRGQRLARGRGRGLGTLKEEDKADTCTGATAANTCKQPSSACMASSTSSCAAGNRMKTFFYGHVEPMKIITVRTFKIPTSFSAKQSRIRNPGFYKRESHAVDTSDLGVALEEMPVWEEVQASLLCSLEKEQRGHLIAESVCTDGLLQDEGTQTYSFLSAPFRRNTSLADLTAAKPLELHLQLQVESVTSRHNKASSAFTFLCGHIFQRREYGKHYKNIHNDIQMGVNGWFEQRCPLAYLGCTYSQKRLQPSTHEAEVTYNEDLGCFSLQPTVPVSLGDSSQPARSSVDSFTAPRKRRGVRAGGGEDSLSSLPYEVLCHMASFLDSLSLSQLALVSQLMRQVCSSLLQERGMVTLRWERTTCSQGGAKWRVKQKASLLCSLEKEQRGHLIAESVCTDGLLQDEGTQTYSFLSAPFRRNTSLADLTAAKPLELHLQLQVESVTSRHNKASSAFTFLCGHIFQRREYGKHYKNIHNDIQMGVNGWFEQRCPLAYLGCTYSQKRLQPSTHEAEVTYNEDLGCFSLQPTVPVSLGDSSQPARSSVDSFTAPRKRRGVRAGGGEDSLSSLPYEVLCHMASFLDSLSLSQLALVSQLMRQVCSSLLQERGMVTLRWERTTCSQGGAKWRVKQKVWQFSSLFSPVDTWCFRDAPSMSEHLKMCPHYEKESRTEKICLPRMREEVQTKTSCQGPTLVTLFQQRRIMM